MAEELSKRERLRSLTEVVTYRPALTVAIVALSMVAAALEGVGLSFLVPILEQVNSGGSPPQDPEGLLGAFYGAYQLLGVPFTLEYIILGVGLVMVARYGASFLVAWLRAALQTDYIRHLQTELFDAALDARVSYFDRRGSDEILNAIVTQARYAGRSIRHIVRIFEMALVSLVYLAIAMYLAPTLTVLTAVVLGGSVGVIRYGLESGYAVGDRVADANEEVQEVVQAGTQGIRDVKLFRMTDELFTQFRTSVDKYADSLVTLQRNKAGIDNLYQLTVAVTVFGLIYFAVTFSSLSLSGLGVFLFAMFRLGPKLSALNDYVYNAEGDLPHLVRTQGYMDELNDCEEPNPATETLPEPVDRVTFEDVSFGYETGEATVDDVSFGIERGEFVAFVGPSGAGKSTIVSLLTRLYDPDEGQIFAEDTPIQQVDVDEWRSRVSVVRQNPHIFNDTLRYNVTVGNRDASQDEVERVCEIAQVTEFVDDMPNGYDSMLGDDGVRLSGGQRQRIAIARTLLEDADLLLFDEATSDLDTALEQRVHAGIEEMERDHALLVVAHRLSTVTNADRIYAMKDGRITEQGPHEELLEEQGNYASLYSVQQ